jgi:hypothetical protein
MDVSFFPWRDSYQTAPVEFWASFSASEDSKGGQFVADRWRRYWRRAVVIADPIRVFWAFPL